jgi:transposase
MIVIGADTHKGSHALAPVDEGTGRVRGSREIKADDAGHLAAVRWARDLDAERVWAIEDCRSCSRRLEQAVRAAGERVVRVAPHRMGASRKGEREPGKSDEIDALAVARAGRQGRCRAVPAAPRVGIAATPYGLRVEPDPATQAESVTRTSHRSSDRTGDGDPAAARSSLGWCY